MSEEELPQGSPPNLSRVQVYLYAVLALFGGVLFAGPVRTAADAMLGGRTLLVFVGAGVLVGGGLALAAIAVVTRGMRGLPAEQRYRLSRLHTISLTGVVVAFLVVATVRPSLLAPEPQRASLVLPTNLAAAVPLAAAVTTLLALGIAYRRLNHGA